MLDKRGYSSLYGIEKNATKEAIRLVVMEYTACWDVVNTVTLVGKGILIYDMEGLLLKG